jgi:hypothetical protein
MIVTVMIRRSTSLRKSRRIGRETIGRSAGRTMPILQMQHFQKTGNLSDELVAKVQNAARGEHRARLNIALCPAQIEQGTTT